MMVSSNSMNKLMDEKYTTNAWMLDLKGRYPSTHLFKVSSFDAFLFSLKGAYP